MKTHLNLSTRDLEKSVAFYSALLEAVPVKSLSDYALFVTERPGLELALDLRGGVEIGNDVHYTVHEDTEGRDESPAECCEA